MSTRSAPPEATCSPSGDGRPGSRHDSVSQAEGTFRSWIMRRCRSGFNLRFDGFAVGGVVGDPGPVTRRVTRNDPRRRNGGRC